jgi:hypothetical protein
MNDDRIFSILDLSFVGSGQMRILVENFGIIKSANVDIGGYTIFVGDNNSGKTYLMQLIYGVLDALKFVRFPTTTVPSSSLRALEVNEIVNKWLDESKENIVFETFKKKISIASLKIYFENSEALFSVRQITAEMYRNMRGEVAARENLTDNIQSIFAISENEKINSFCFFYNPNDILSAQTEMLRSAVDRFVGRHLQGSNVYLPASRSGLMLTRPFVFASQKSDGVVVSDEPKSAKGRENIFGLTQPVYDFLVFLQTHKTSEGRIARNNSLISFINRNIIHGEMKKTDNESFYQPEGSEEWLPPSITSSMVNEISPVMQILTSVRDIQYILYDEIETCQHPTTQVQMAKLLNRMINAGYRIIVSTHSDTMAVAINNAIALEKIKDSEEKLDQVGCVRADVLKKNDIVHAYQFIKSEEGTVVEEVRRHSAIGLNFDFTLFNEANRNLYDTYQLLK